MRSSGKQCLGGREAREYGRRNPGKTDHLLGGRVCCLVTRNACVALEANLKLPCSQNGELRECRSVSMCVVTEMLSMGDGRVMVCSASMESVCISTEPLGAAAAWTRAWRMATSFVWVLEDHRGDGG